MEFWKVILSKVANMVPSVSQMTEKTLSWNVRDGKLHGLKVNADGTKEIVDIGSQGASTHARAHQINNVADHPPVEEKNRGKLVATDPETGAISFIDLTSLNKVIFSQLANKTIGNTNIEQSIFGTGTGSLNIAANTLMAGNVIRLKTYGVISANKDTNEEVTFKVYLGNVPLHSVTGNLFQGLDVASITIEILVTCRTAGTEGSVMPAGGILVEVRAGGGYQSMLKIYSSNDISIDTMKDNQFNVTFKWTSAKVANTLTTNVSLLEKL